MRLGWVVRNLGCLLLATLVAGCGTSGFRNIVFESFGPEAIVLQTPGFIPPKSSQSYKTNDFQYPPGSIVNPVLLQPSNAFTGAAGLLVATNGECVQTTLPLNRFALTRLADIDREQVVDLSFSFLNGEGLQTFRNNFDLREVPPDAFVFIRSIVLQFRKVKVYEANSAELRAAARQIARLSETGRRYCGLTGERADQSQIIKRIFVAHVTMKLRWDAGARTVMGPAWDAKLQRSLRYSYTAKRMIFAVAMDPLRNSEILQIVSGSQSKMQVSRN